jgi:hypothetical protein
VHRLDLCIFCLRDDGGFESAEHVLPESLGNERTVLRRGVVCDRCNSQRLAALDQALVQCPPVSLLKTVHGIRNKKKRLPFAKIGEDGLYALGEGEMCLRVLDEQAITDRDRSFDVEMTQRYSSEQWKRVARCLLKAGFEMHAHDNGKSYVMDERFDGLRTAIRDGGFNGWIAYTHSGGDLSSELSLQYPVIPMLPTSRLGLLVEAVVFGIRLCTAWPARRDLLPAHPHAEDFHCVDFPRGAARESSDTMTMRFTVEYGSSQLWDNSTPVPAAIPEIDRRRGES